MFYNANRAEDFSAFCMWLFLSFFRRISLWDLTDLYPLSSTLLSCSPQACSRIEGTFYGMSMLLGLLNLLSLVIRGKVVLELGYLHGANVTRHNGWNQKGNTFTGDRRHMFLPWALIAGDRRHMFSAMMMLDDWSNLPRGMLYSLYLIIFQSKLDVFLWKVCRQSIPWPVLSRRSD